MEPVWGRLFTELAAYTKTWGISVIVVALGAALNSSIALATMTDEPLTSMDLESLMNLNVTTVTKRKHNLMKAASAIYVIRKQDIRRSGATSLPEVLLLAPGLDVQHINRFTWGVSARGLNSQFANKLLVLVDGRSVYNPYFAGVFWDSLLPSLNDIERIEVIRGPGSSLWGSNAVNGVINIITADSEITPGAYVTVGAGNEEAGFTRMRRGFRFDEVTGRINVDYRKVDDSILGQSGHSAQDDYETYQVSSRLDWRPTMTDIATFDFGFLDAKKNAQFYLDESLQGFDTPRSEFDSDGAWIQGLWLHEFNNGDSLQAKIFWDEEHRIDQIYRYDRDSWDLDLQYNKKRMNGHQITGGVNTRYTVDEAEGGFIIDATKNENSYSRHAAFLQDEIDLTSTVSTTLGVKVEDGDFTPLQFQPTWRLAWLPTETLTIWAALTRAVRTPSPAERFLAWRYGSSSDVDAILASIFPQSSGKVFNEFRGNPEFASEKTNTAELGARTTIDENIFIDLAFYRTKLKNLQSFAPLYLDFNFPEKDYIRVVANINNGSKGDASGVEIASQIDFSSNLRLKAGYAYTHFDTTNTLDIGIDYYTTLERSTPLNSAYLLLQGELEDRWEFDIKTHYFDSTAYISSYNYESESRVDLSARLGYELEPDVMLSLVGKQLQDPEQTEMVSSLMGPVHTEMQRSIFLQIDWMNL